MQNFDCCILFPKYLVFSEDAARDLFQDITQCQQDFVDQKSFSLFFAVSYKKNIKELLPNGDRGRYIWNYEEFNGLTIGNLPYEDYVEFMSTFCESYKQDFINSDYSLELKNYTEFKTLTLNY